jgi:Ser/Thr protein kinase RdoA (MazF antagonist)
MNNEHDIAAIVENFQFEGDYVKAHPYGFGHINDTYAVYFRRSNGWMRRYILQRINHYVFKDPVGLMENIQKVTDHLREKIKRAGGNADRETLTLIPSVSGKSYYKSPQGNYWRGYIFIEDARTYQTVESMAHIYNAALAFGRFQNRLSDFPAHELHEAIPDFHNTAKRFETFVRAVEEDVANRAHAVEDEIAFLEARADDTHVLVDLLAQGKLPERVTHNDTKFNNVMIDDESGEGICVIDLDTVMPGLSLYDFGDSARSATNPAAEDTLDLSEVNVDLEVFDHLTHGYLDAAREALTPREIDYLPFAVKLMTLENGMRFLTDYLQGDVYFKIHRPNHNLDRSRAQLKLVESMEANFERMRAIVEKYR